MMNITPLNTTEMTQQLENAFMSPMRSMAAMNIDFMEKMVNAQLDAGKAYVDASMTQARNLMDVKDAEGLRHYMESQQEVAKNMAERVKGDADKVVGLQQDYMKQSQKLTEEGVKKAQESAAKMTKSA